ncbi:hypothetical protein QBC36DRAFT_193606 [Triangularia setosa]|uniref:BTB domain-containing protein n=1 Tax=Triangularia setosa TaxID=2587417 RepID=A0AAN6W1Y2_9PEZI|nr:hypothetical protein QBC36DRAFT_193606 [Podospora setosa]
MAPPSLLRGASRGRGGSPRVARGISSRGGGPLVGRGGRGNRAPTPVAPTHGPVASISAPSSQNDKQTSPEPGSAPTRRRVPKALEPIGKPWSVNSMAYRPDQQALKVLETGEFSDAIVLADGREWRVHRALLGSRSRWFERVFKSQAQDDLNDINLYPLKREFVDLLLQTLYSNRLPEQYLNVHGEHATFANYVKIFKLADQFEVDTMRNDALTLLGQLADRHLEELCTFDKSLSGREGVLEPKTSFPYQNLALAILEAFGGEHDDKRAQCLLANFLYAGRAVLLENRRLKEIVDRDVQLAAALWHASQGRNLAAWLPNPEVIGYRLRAFDHSKKTQHPDRCELCDDVFDSENRKRIMFDPYKVVLRPAGYCALCVEKHKDDPECLFRKTGRTEKQNDGMASIKTEPDLLDHGEEVAVGIIPSIEDVTGLQPEQFSGLSLQGPTMSTPAPPTRLSMTPLLMPPPPLPSSAKKASTKRRAQSTQPSNREPPAKKARQERDQEKGGGEIGGVCEQE